MRQLRFASAQGRIDDEGRFFPSDDPLVSAQSGFVFYVDMGARARAGSTRSVAEGAAGAGS